MPSFDGGHYFLTALIPLHTAPCEGTGGALTSPIHAVREALASLPTALHSPACVAGGFNSPFSRSPRTHFARFAVLDDVAYNGRDPQDAILSTVHGTDLLKAQPIDRLGRPYLLFCADFDARDGSEAELDSYCAELWSVMRPELTAILTHCEAFDARTKGGAASEFSAYVRACRIDTTMPFNDYRIDEAPAKPVPVVKPAVMLAVGVLIASLLMAWWVVRNLGGSELMFGALAGLILAVVAALIAAAAYLYLRVRSIGSRSAAWSPDVDLRTALKALWLQHSFIDFVVGQQGASPQALHAAFGAFLATARPADLDGPTQAPGVIR